MQFTPQHQVIAVNVNMSDAEAETLVKDINTISQNTGLAADQLRANYPALSELFDGVEAALAKDAAA